MEDVLTKATADGVRIYALCTTNLVQEAAKKHGCSHLASAALGRAMNGALLLAATMKDNERISLRLKGDGPLGEVVADAEECAKLAIAVERRVPKGSERRRHAAHTSQSAVHHVEQAGEEYYATSPSNPCESLCLCDLGSVDEHSRSYEVEHKACCGDEVGSNANLYHAFNDRVDNDIDNLLQEIPVVHILLFFVLNVCYFFI